MRAQVIDIKNRLLGSGGTTSGVLGGIGSIHNVCHSICLTIVSILAIFGISISILPLMFLQTYQMYFWLMALVFTTTSFYFYQKQRSKSVRDRNLLLVNSGLLTFGLPISQISILSFLVDYMDFFRFVGLSLTIVAIFLFFFAKKFRYVEFPVSEPSKTNVTEAAHAVVPISSTIHLPKLTVSSVLFALVIGGFLVNQYLMYRMGVFDKMNMSLTTSTMTSQSRMSFTLFDVALAKERMDKNNDGICDVCGMPIQTCIDSGQMDCNMGNNPHAIGILGSQHIHADFKVYVDGQALDFAKPDYYMKSSFIHVDNSQNKNDASGVLHMHATNVPLWLFFKSIGMKLEKKSLTTADGQILTNGNGNTLKFYLNGKKVDELGDYVFQPLDKLLVSFGSENDPDIQKQISSVTDFAKDHQK